MVLDSSAEKQSPQERKDELRKERASLVDLLANLPLTPENDRRRKILQSTLDSINRLLQAPPRTRDRSWEEDQQRKSSGVRDLRKSVPRIDTLPQRKIIKRSALLPVEYPDALKRVFEKYAHLDRDTWKDTVGFCMEQFRGKKRYSFYELGISIIAEDVRVYDRDRLSTITETLGGHLPREIDISLPHYVSDQLYPQESEFDAVIATMPGETIQQKGVIFGKMLGIQQACFTARMRGSSPSQCVVRQFYTKHRERGWGTPGSVYYTRSIRFLSK